MTSRPGVPTLLALTVTTVTVVAAVAVGVAAADGRPGTHTPAETPATPATVDRTAGLPGVRDVPGSSPAPLAAVVEGTVVGPDGDPIENATVRVPLAGEDVTTRTDAAGEFALDLSNRTVPESVTVVVTRLGYLPGTRLVGTDGSESVTVRLDRTGQRSVLVDGDLHHLGDGEYSGQINSQFQEGVEGEHLSATFRLNDVQAGATGATLRFALRGSQCGNPVSVNGQEVAALGTSDASGDVSNWSVEVNASVLRSGENTFAVEAGSCDPTDLDDFEISNVRLFLEGVPRDTESPTLTVEAPGSASPGDEVEFRVEAADDNRVQSMTVTLARGDETVLQRTVRGSEWAEELVLNDSGTYTLSVQAVDQSGNVREATATTSVGGGGILGFQPVHLAILVLLLLVVAVVVLRVGLRAGD